MDNQIIPKTQIKNKITTIVIPPESGKEELLSLCIALHFTPWAETVQRRRVTIMDLRNPKTMVLGSGGIFNPNLELYDSPNLMENALTLLCQSITLELSEGTTSLEAILMNTRWFMVKSVTKGRIFYGPDPRLGKLLGDFVTGPIEQALFDVAFGHRRVQKLHISMLRSIGAAIVNRAVASYSRVHTTLKSAVLILDIGPISALILEDSDHRDVGMFRESYCEGVTLGALHRDDGPGWIFHKWLNDDRIDLCRIDLPDIQINDRGYLAHTRKMYTTNYVVDQIMPMALTH